MQCLMSLDGSQCTDSCYWVVLHALFLSLDGSQSTDLCYYVVLAALICVIE